MSLLFAEAKERIGQATKPTTSSSGSLVPKQESKVCMLSVTTMTCIWDSTSSCLLVTCPHHLHQVQDGLLETPSANGWKIVVLKILLILAAGQSWSKLK
jgi:hypothetical protein